MSGMRLKTPEYVSDKRKKELVVLARKSRNRWVSTATDSKLPYMDDRTEANPVVESVQSVLEYFRQLIGEEEVVDLSDILVVDDDDEFSDLQNIPVPAYTPDCDPYRVFLQKMQHPAASQVAIGLQKNVRKLRSTVISTDDHAMVTDAIFSFLARFEEELREHELWITESQTQFQHTCESLESFVFVKLYDVLFPLSDASRQRDQQLRERLKLLKFLTWEHLDIRHFEGMGCGNLEEAVKALQEINMHKSPHAKVNCLKRMSKALTKVLRTAKSDGSLPGADDFLPALILTVKEANPDQFRSNLDYLLRCVHPSKLVAEAGYLITHIDSALHFLETLESSSLTISHADFEKAVQICREELNKEQQTLANRQQLESEQHSQHSQRQAVLSKPKQHQFRLWEKQLASTLQPTSTPNTYQEVSVQAVRRWRAADTRNDEQKSSRLPYVSLSPQPRTAIDGDMNVLYEALAAARRDLTRVGAVGDGPMQSAQNQIFHDSFRRCESVLEQSLNLEFVGASAEALCVADVRKLVAEHHLLYRLSAALLGRVAASPLALKSDVVLQRSTSRSSTDGLLSPGGIHSRRSPNFLDGASSSVNDNDSLLDDADDVPPSKEPVSSRPVSSKDVSLFGPDYAPTTNGNPQRVPSTRILKTGSGTLF